MTTQRMVKGNVAYKREQDDHAWMVDHERVWFYPNEPRRGAGVLPEDTGKSYPVLIFTEEHGYFVGFDQIIRRHPYNYDRWMVIPEVNL